MMSDILSLYEQANPEATAIAQIDGPPLTYSNLVSCANDCGASFANLGIQSDDRVAIVMPNGPLMASTFASCLPWVSVAPLNPAYTEDELEFYLKDLTPKLVLVEKGVDSPAIEVARALSITVVEIDRLSSGQLFAFALGSSVATRRQKDAVALVLHTSGTTARPKMVPLTQGNLLASSANTARTLELTAKDICLNVMPLFHIHGLMAPLMATFSVGASVVCTPGFDALRFYAWLAAADPTWYSAVPTMHQAIVARAERNREVCNESRLRFIRSASASLPVQVLTELEAAFNTRVVEAYAMTEAAHQMCSNPLPPKPRKPGTVGPQAGPEVRIASPTEFRVLTQGEEGEIIIRGDNVTMGYINNPEANAKDFRDGWFRTGDLGVMDSDGYVKVTGRLKEIINRGGEKVAPVEVEEALLNHQSIAQVCVFAIPHEKLGEDVGAVVVLKDGENVTVSEIQSVVRARLSSFKVPRTVVFREDIPKGATGKVQRIGMAERIGLSS